MKKVIYFLALFLLVFAFSCKKEWKNVYDNNFNPETSAPSDLVVELASDSSIQLNWKDNSFNNEGFKIDRKYNNENWKVAYAITKSKATEYIDDNTFVAGKYSYKVYAYNKEKITNKIEKIIYRNTIPIVQTDTITNITDTSVVCYCNLVDTGGLTIINNGVCWSTNSKPTINDNKTIQNTGLGVYSSNINSLQSNITYYIRAYATNEKGVSYGNELMFNTNASLPTITTNTVTNITINSAKSGGNITSNGNATITQRGVCWGTTQNPTIANDKTNDGTGTGNFTSNITGLQDNTTYYVRAYATNSVGTSYGEQMLFTTLDLTTPTITTNTVTNITINSATSGGNITSNGNSTITQRGVCWGTAQNPTIANDKTNDGIGTGNFTSNITGLQDNTTYYLRAYATNSEGTSYGDERTLTTLELTTPTITTNTVTNITINSAKSGGNITSNGNATITQRGVCWSTTQNPTIANDKTNDGTGTGNFTSNITGLQDNTTYYLRAYATNSGGTAYGDERTFTTILICGDDISDIDGNTYGTVQIGNQCWLKENLKVTHYPNGDPIPNITESTAWDNLDDNNIDDAYCWYNNDINNKAVYGALYTYAAAIADDWQRDNSSINGDGGQGVCPDGWHLPTDAEWTTLTDYLDTNAGSKLAGNEPLWTDGDLDQSADFGTSGFSALPGGYRIYNGDFNGLGSHGLWWSVTEYNNIASYYHYLYYNSAEFSFYQNYKSSGFSVRCVRD